MFDDLLEDPFPKNTKLGKALDAFEDNFKCPICYEFFHNPSMLTGCGHVFCGECILKNLQSSNCPKCRKAVSSQSELKPVVVLSNIVHQFKELRDELLVCVTSGNIVESVVSSVNNQIKTDKPASTPLFKKIPPLHFHGLSKEKLKKAILALCESSTVKLSTEGEKDVLEKRYTSFVHLNNSQCFRYINLSQI